MCVDRKLSLWSHQHSCKCSRIVGVGEMESHLESPGGSDFPKPVPKLRWNTLDIKVRVK